MKKRLPRASPKGKTHGPPAPRRLATMPPGPGICRAMTDVVALADPLVAALDEPAVAPIMPGVCHAVPLEVERLHSAKGVVAEAGRGALLGDGADLAGREVAELALAGARRLLDDVAGRVMDHVARGAAEAVVAVVDAAEAVAVVGVRAHAERHGARADGVGRGCGGCRARRR